MPHGAIAMAALMRGSIVFRYSGFAAPRSASSLFGGAPVSVSLALL